MKVAVAAETDTGESRVAATPETVKKMIGLGAEVAVEPDAGIKSGVLDADYAAAGAVMAADAMSGADVVLKVRRPESGELSRLSLIHIYACRSRADMAFLEALEKLDPNFRHLHFDEEAGGKVLDLAAAIAEAPPDAHFYCCGPNPMLKAFEAVAANRPRDHVHVEYFTAKEEASTTGGFWVELARSGEEYFIPEGKKILEVLFDAGIDVDYSCELGICGACETRVISGIPDHRDAVLSAEEQDSNTKVMICCCGSKTERLVLDM